MRTRAAVASVLASLGVLAVGWQLGAAHEAHVASQASVPVVGTTSQGSSTPAAPAAPTTAPDATYVGSTVNTRFGPVQVQVTVSGGAITDVTALQLTNADGRSVQISNRAAPILRSEVLAAQSARVSTVSGATYTTQGYLKSLQSALDQAGL
ncbi:MAG: FMN-binding protein [Rhodoglobus sp.]